MRISLAGLAFGVLGLGSAYAQYVISAHSGVVHYVEGRALLNDDPVDPKFGQFPDIKEGQVFRTEEGRAEVLLTPGVLLRMGENSSIKMVSNKLTDTRVEILAGTTMVECDEVPKDNAIMLLYKANSMILTKHGLYRLEAQPARFMVYDGEAIVKGESGQVTLKGGKATALDGALMATNFDKNSGDDLYAWSNRRASYMAKANLSSAMSLRNSGYSNGGLYNPWQWNSLFGMFAFVPNGGMTGYSPFGYYYWNPYTVMYAPTYYGGGYGGGGSGGGNVGLRAPNTPFSGARTGTPVSGRVSNSGVPSFPGNTGSLFNSGGGGSGLTGSGGSGISGGSGLSAPSVSSGGGGMSRGGGGSSHR